MILQVYDFDLSAEEMKKIAILDKGLRVYKESMYVHVIYMDIAL